jgi:hypothetical protein
MLKYIDRIPLLPLAIAAVFMALAPFAPEPHLVEKSRMLMHGELSRGIDIFDLFWHSFLIVLLAIRLIRFTKAGK